MGEGVRDKGRERETRRQRERRVMEGQRGGRDREKEREMVTKEQGVEGEIPEQLEWLETEIGCCLHPASPPSLLHLPGERP